MIIDFKQIESQPELIPVRRLETLLNRKISSVNRFLRVQRVERVRDGQKSYIVKGSLLRALKAVNAKPIEMLEG